MADAPVPLTPDPPKPTGGTALQAALPAALAAAQVAAKAVTPFGTAQLVELLSKAGVRREPVGARGVGPRDPGPQVTAALLALALAIAPAACPGTGVWVRLGDGYARGSVYLALRAETLVLVPAAACETEATAVVRHAARDWPAEYRCKHWVGGAEYVVLTVRGRLPRVEFAQ